MPHLINYFETYHISSEARLADLLVDYLVNHKKIIDTELMENLKSLSSDSNSVYENFIKLKDMGHVVRFFSDKKFTMSKLASSLENHLSMHVRLYLDREESAPSLVLLETLLLAPIVFTNSQTLGELIDRVSATLIDRLKSSLDQNERKETEMNTFLFSVCQWSILMLNRSSSMESRVQAIVDLMQRLTEHEKSVGHLLRSLNYNLTFSANSDWRLTPIETVLDLVKSQLSSANHETRLNALNILTGYFKRDINTVDPVKLDGNEELDLFQIASRAEMTPASLDNYRKKIFYLQRLDTNVCSKYLQINGIKDVWLT